MSRRKTSTSVAIAALTLVTLTNLLSNNSIDVSAADKAGLSTLRPNVGGAEVIINEVDSDTPGTDVAEFVELYDGGLGNTSLDGYVVVFFNGANDLSYAAFDLDGLTTNAGGFFTLGNAAVPGVDLVFANGGLQNGPDGVAIFSANAADFPNGTPVTTLNLRDALVYSNATTIDMGLLVLLNAGQPQVNENGAATGTTVSMQRIPNGSGGQRNTNSYQVLAPTPDGPNLGPAVVTVSLAGRVTDAFGHGIGGARLLLESSVLPAPRLALTSSFGYYSFDGLPAGTYMVTINSKRHVFAVPTRVITISENVANFDFVAEP